MSEAMPAPLSDEGSDTSDPIEPEPAPCKGKVVELDAARCKKQKDEEAAVLSLFLF